MKTLKRVLLLIGLKVVEITILILFIFGIYWLSINALGFILWFAYVTGVISFVGLLWIVFTINWQFVKRRIK